MTYKVITRKDRFIIVDASNKLIDDASGHGFKTYQSAHKFMWYKINQEDIDARKIIAQKFIEENPKIKDYNYIFDIDHIEKAKKLDPAYDPWKTMYALVKQKDKELFAKLKDDIKIKNAIKRVMLECCGFA